MSLPDSSATESAWAPPQWGPRWSRRLAKLVCSLLWRVEVHGAENIPATGRIIVAANHTGFIDGPVMLGFTPRPAHFLVKGAFFKGVLGVVMRACGQIPVVRGRGRESLSAGKQVLLRDDAVGIFPEGTRGQGAVTALHPGVGWLSLHTQTAVVPAALLGSRATGASVRSLPKWRSRVVVVFGEPLQPVHELAAQDITREHITDMTKTVQQAMQNLLVDSQQTYKMQLPTDEGTQGHPRSHV